MQKTVPKFGSFRPKSLTSSHEVRSPTPLDQTHDHESTSKLKSSNKNDHKGKRGHSVARDGDESLQDQLHRIPDPDPYLTLKISGKRHAISQAESGNGQSKFVSDYTGDPGILAYGSNSRALVPDYRLSRKWRTLGDTSAQQSESLSTKSLLSNPSRDIRLLLKSEGHYLAPVIPEVASGDYLPIAVTRQRHRFGLHGNNPSAATGGPTSEVQGEIFLYESESSTSENSLLDVEPVADDQGLDIRQKSAALLNRIVQHPQNVHAWLRYIEFQDRWAGQNNNNQDAIPLTAAEERSVAQVKISLYEDALDKVVNDQDDRSMLLLGLLKEGEKTWTVDKLISKWQDAANNNQHCLDVQLEYLNFMQINFSAFSYADCRDQYATYINLLSHDVKLSSLDRAMRQMYALLRLTSYVRDSGFTELARSLWQAQLEISCLTPQNVHYTHAEIVASFGKYWDNEKPRIGEDNSFGWYPSEKAAPSFANENYVEAQSSQTGDVNPLHTWLAAYNNSRFRLSMPKRTIDASDQDDDPYRVVFFSDIESFVMDILPEYRHFLVEAFLCYHQLPGLPGSRTSASRWWWQDSFLKSARWQTLEASMQVRVQHVVTSTETLFGLNQEFFASRQEEYGSKLDRSTAKFVGNVLYSLTKAISVDTDLAEYYLAFDYKMCPERARKTAKKLLRSNPSRTAIYNAYGLLESRLGNRDLSNHVFSTAANLVASLGTSERLQVVMIQRAWIWEALRTNDILLARGRLFTIGPNTDSIRTWFLDCRDRAIQKNLHREASLSSELLALQSYLSAPGFSNLPAALSTFAEESEKLATIELDATYAVELLHQAQCQMLRHHMDSHKLYSPKVIRDTLRPSIISFPTNTMFLSLYAENERRFRVDDRVRDVTRDILLGEDKETVIAWLFALRTEIERGEIAATGTTVHSTRATFQKAVTSPVGKHCSTIWLAYLLWEIEVSFQKALVTSERLEDRRKSVPQQLDMAKKVWLRGINVLPWVKDFVVIGMELLRTGMLLDNYRGFENLMEERGLRL